MRPADLDPERKAMLDAILAEDGVSLLELSCVSDEGVMAVRNAACDALLAHRVESKEKTKRVENVANRVRVAVPVARDGTKREPFIPAKVLTRIAYNKADPDRRRLERDIEEENGGAGAFSVDMKSAYFLFLLHCMISRTDSHFASIENYILKNPEWKYDIMPELQDGKNVADFIDPDIVARLEELEREEERLEASGFYDDEEDVSLPPSRTAYGMKTYAINLNSSILMKTLFALPRQLSEIKRRTSDSSITKRTNSRIDPSFQELDKLELFRRCLRNLLPLVTIRPTSRSEHESLPSLEV